MRLPRRGALEALAFDPASVLLGDPGVLVDPVFMGALHGEFETRLGAADAPVALLQLGFLHGLRDALHAVGDVFDAAAPVASRGAALAAPAATSGLAIAFTPRASQLHPGSLEIVGTWPERSEAEARLCRSGSGAREGCMVSAGYTSGWLSGTLEANLLAVETSCCARGEPTCGFLAREPEAWARAGDARALALLEVLPFATLRALVGRREVVPHVPEAAPQDGAFDPQAAVVHIWGPVMVIPFAGPEEAMHAMELIGSDASARQVSVVVLDLRGAIIDDAFGAAALERIVETAERWDAEALFAGASALSEPVLDGLERQPLMVLKDVEEAIAIAFQIARSQRAVA